jgi:hypothetical protein
VCTPDDSSLRFIDKHMYEMLMNADVVADLSTTNPNAIYELGVRHALRPHTTVNWLKQLHVSI